MDVSTETETPDFEECFKVKDDREPDLQRHVMFLSSRYHFSADDVNSGQASRLTNTVSRYHWVLNAAARVITNTLKFDRGLTSILHDDLHWLDLLRRVLFKICVMVYKSLHGMAPKYLAELCRPISDSGAPSPPLCSAWTSAHTSLLPIHVRKTSLFLCRSICLEFSSRTSAGIWSVTQQL